MESDYAVKSLELQTWLDINECFYDENMIIKKGVGIPSEIVVSRIKTIVNNLH